MGVFGTLATVVLFAATNTKFWAWLAIAFLSSVVVAMGWAYRDLHRDHVKLVAGAEPPGTDPRRARLSDELVALIERGQFLANHDSPHPSWFVPEHDDWLARAHALLDAALGPTAATDFGRIGRDLPRNGPAAGFGGWQAELREKAGYLREVVLPTVDSARLMGDWRP